MPKLARLFQKQFGVNGGASDFGKFGSLADGLPQYTQDPAAMQSLTHFLAGWVGATIGDRVPPLEDMNSLFFLAFYQLCYLLQQGIPEYDASTTYYSGSYCTSAGIIYKSLQDSNLNHAPNASPTWWEPLVIGDGADFFNLASIPSNAGVIPAANLPVGTTANKVVQLDASAKLPAVDGSQLTGIVGFGLWETKSWETVYLASTDGLVLGDTSGGSGIQMWGYSDSSNPPTTIRMKGAYNSGIGETGRITMPVRKGDYWKFTGNGSKDRLFWISLGA